jgi:hypothetical protein
MATVKDGKALVKGKLISQEPLVENLVVDLKMVTGVAVLRGKTMPYLTGFGSSRHSIVIPTPLVQMIIDAILNGIEEMCVVKSIGFIKKNWVGMQTGKDLEPSKELMRMAGHSNEFVVK